MPPKKAKASAKKASKKAGARSQGASTDEMDFDFLMSKVLEGTATEEEELNWRLELANDDRLYLTIHEIKNTLLAVHLTSKDEDDFNYNEYGPALLFALMRYDAILDEAYEKVTAQPSSAPAERGSASTEDSEAREGSATRHVPAHERASRKFMASGSQYEFSNVDLIEMVASGKETARQREVFEERLRKDREFQNFYIGQESYYLRTDNMNKEIVLRLRLAACFAPEALQVGPSHQISESGLSQWEVDHKYIMAGLGAARIKPYQKRDPKAQLDAREAADTRNEMPKYPKGDVIDLVGRGQASAEQKTTLKQQIYDNKEVHQQVLQRLHIYQEHEKRNYRRLKAFYDGLDTGKRNLSDPRSAGQKARDSVRDLDRTYNIRPKSEVVAKANRGRVELPSSLGFRYRWRAKPADRTAKSGATAASRPRDDQEGGAASSSHAGEGSDPIPKARIIPVPEKMSHPLSGPGSAGNPATFYPLHRGAGPQTSPSSGSASFHSAILHSSAPRQASASSTVVSGSPNTRRSMLDALSEAVDELSDSTVSAQIRVQIRRQSEAEAPMDPRKARNRLRHRLQASQAARRGDPLSDHEAGAAEVKRMIDRTRNEIDAETRARASRSASASTRTGGRASSDSDHPQPSGSHTETEGRSASASQSDTDRMTSATSASGSMAMPSREASASSARSITSAPPPSGAAKNISLSAESLNDDLRNRLVIRSTTQAQAQSSTEPIPWSTAPHIFPPRAGTVGGPSSSVYFDMGGSPPTARSGGPSGSRMAGPGASSSSSPRSSTARPGSATSGSNIPSSLGSVPPSATSYPPPLGFVQPTDTLRAEVALRNTSNPSFAFPPEPTRSSGGLPILPPLKSVTARTPPPRFFSASPGLDHAASGGGGGGGGGGAGSGIEAADPTRVRSGAFPLLPPPSGVRGTSRDTFVQTPAGENRWGVGREGGGADDRWAERVKERQTKQMDRMGAVSRKRREGDADGKGRAGGSGEGK